MHNLTRRQKEALDAISQYITENSYPPAFRDIARIMGLRSSSTINDFLQQLKKKGYVDWEEGQPRTLRIIKTAS